jgi:hypothetical protein
MLKERIDLFSCFQRKVLGREAYVTGYKVRIFYEGFLLPPVLSIV